MELLQSGVFSEQNYSQLRQLALGMFSIWRASVVNHNDSVGGLSKLRAGEKLTLATNDKRVALSIYRRIGNINMALTV